MTETQEPRLPNGVTRRKDGVIVVNPNDAYPPVLAMLGVKGKPTQYDLECATQCVKLAIMDRVDPPDGQVLSIMIEGGAANKAKWALAQHAEKNAGGKTARDATHGREAAAHYQRIKNRI